MICSCLNELFRDIAAISFILYLSLAVSLAAGLMLLRIDTHKICAYGPWCFECADVSYPAECGRVRKCQQNQKCYTEKYDTSMAFPKFNSGCEDSTVCQNYVKRESFFHHVGDVTLCKSCCDNNGCNGALCGANTFKNSGTLCFNCQSTRKPEECQSVTLCQQQACSWRRRHSVFYAGDVYDMGCMPETDCKHGNSTHCCGKSFCNGHSDFDCGDGSKIVRDKLCNGNTDCSDGTDELNCTSPQVFVG